MDFTHPYRSPLGGMTLASDGEALVGLWFDGQRHFAQTLSPSHSEKDLPIFLEAERWLDRYFRGEDPGVPPPLRMRGTAFRRLVWELLLRIPYGKTVTYGELAAETARRLGRSRMSAQAVGGAVGHNGIAILIPCHRVVGADGSLTGYAGGLEKKRRLLELEAAVRRA